LSKNRLEIIETQCDLVADTLYIVRDANRVYMKTKHKSVAETAFNQLKTEYQRTENAS
jgi:hypothetical protein